MLLTFLKDAAATLASEIGAGCGGVWQYGQTGTVTDEGILLLATVLQTTIEA